MSNYAYSNLTLNGRFTEDGEYFIMDTDLNGVPVTVITLYVGDQREKFQAAHDAGQPQEAEPAPAAPAA